MIHHIMENQSKAKQIPTMNFNVFYFDLTDITFFASFEKNNSTEISGKSLLVKISLQVAASGFEGWGNIYNNVVIQW